MYCTFSNCFCRCGSKSYPAASMHWSTATFSSPPLRDLRSSSACASLSCQGHHTRELCGCELCGYTRSRPNSAISVICFSNFRKRALCMSCCVPHRTAFLNLVVCQRSEQRQPSFNHSISTLCLSQNQSAGSYENAAAMGNVTPQTCEMHRTAAPPALLTHT
jgi:hypothetical protein